MKWAVFVVSSVSVGSR
uniref:Uncharacterized protein n=1 Tax=Arundo donax TaxID=35708 RepID=A0A0A9NB64_ARUDO